MAFAKLTDNQLTPEWPTLTESSSLLVIPALFYEVVTLLTHDEKTQQFLTYKPPPLVCDLTIRLQTFLC